MAYTGTLFGTVKKSESQHQQIEIDKLIKIQADQLRQSYGTDCLDVKQLQQVFNVGESNAYEWLKSCPAVKLIGRRKVVPVVWLAYYLVAGNI